jgi:histone-lysine N-methyltransferase SETMAR
MDLKVLVITKDTKFCLQKSKTKIMLMKFLEKQGFIHKELVPVGQTVNSVFYVEVIGRVLKRISHVRPQFRAEGSWFLLHDNSPSHSALVVKTFLAQHGVVEISHPPYSPDLTQADFFSFLRWKLPSKERGFRLLKTLRKTRRPN